MTYEQSTAIADKYAQLADYKEAEKYYRRALTEAPPEEIQHLIDMIKEVKQKALTVPKPDKAKQKGQEAGFIKYSITFADVIGYKPHKKLLREFIETPIKYKEAYQKRHMPLSTGILLYGFAGTGKTFLAKGLSGELNLPMKEVYISDIIQKLIGESEKAMRKAFSDAKACMPCILFFDELDALGGSRENSNEVTSNEIKNTVNQFLMEMSQLHDNKDTCVFVIGATNSPWSIDNALKRSGRFEHHIYLRPPSLNERIAIMKYYLKMEDTQLKVNWLLIGLALSRYSQADCEKVANALKRRTLDKKLITTRDIQKIIKDKNIGASSLDNSILEAQKVLIQSNEQVVHKTGFLGWKHDKETIQKQGKLSKEELEIYKPLINNLKSYKRWWLATNVIRFLAQGF